MQAKCFKNALAALVITAASKVKHNMCEFVFTTNTAGP